MFKKIVKQLKIKKATLEELNLVSRPFEDIKKRSQKAFLKTLSEHALDLYEKKSDINKFTNLALSDSQDLSHEEIIEELKHTDFIDPMTDEALFALSKNSKLKKDIGLF